MRFRFAIAIAALAALGLTLASRAQPPGKAQLLSRYAWHSDLVDFGGLSALELAPDGRGFFAMSDRVQLARGRIQRTGDRITGVTLTDYRVMKTPNGTPIQGRAADSEGLALRSDGRLYVSFEGQARVWAYLDPFGPAARMPRHPDFKKMPSNGSLEALAVDKTRLFALPETPLNPRKGLPLYVYEGTSWRVERYLRTAKGFRPVGADFGPDGQFYLLERGFGGIGFRSQVRRFDLTAGDRQGEVLFKAPLGQFGNLEGLSVWQDRLGRIRLTMVSDNNFNFFQRTELVEYVLPQRVANAYE